MAYDTQRLLLHPTHITGHRPLKYGLVLGKFLPPHLGHVHMIEFAMGCVDELTVVVSSLAAEPIAGSLRHAWMQELFPHVRVVHLDMELPQDPSETPEFWTLWRTALQAIVLHPVDVVVASEAYGARLAEELGGRFLCIDPTRSSLHISGTQVRQDPWTHWNYIPRCVRPHFLRRVCLMGPESSGKTTLGKELAAHLQTVCVPEYAAGMVARTGAFTAEDALDAVVCQRADVAALARAANKILLCDSDTLTTKVWSERLFGQVDPQIDAIVEEEAHMFDLTLLFSPDTPYIQDTHRLLPDHQDRIDMFDRMQDELYRLGRPTVVLSGTWTSRRQQALTAIAHLKPPIFS